MVWRAAAEVHGRAGNGAEAARAHEALAAAAPDDSKTLAKLVKALAKADPQRARQLATRLPPIEELEVSASVIYTGCEKSLFHLGAGEATRHACATYPGTGGELLLKVCYFCL